MAGAAPCLLLATVLVGSGHAGPPRWLALDWAKAAMLGASMASYQLCYFWAVPRTGVALTALLAICSAPIMITAGAALVLKERPAPSTLVALLLAVGGTAMVLVGPRVSGGARQDFVAGAFSAIGAGVSYAVYAVTAKGMLHRASPLPLAAATFTLAALLLSPALAVEPHAGAQLVAGWPLLLYLGLVPTAAAYVLFGAGLRRVPATTAGIATLLEPITAASLGVLVFGERLGRLGWVGAALLLLALVLLSRGGSGRQ
jgi:DME family drug/metabolite transporter